ncbi:MAG: Rossmann fold domain-containing protein [Pseudomonadota bacterium]
MGEGRHFEMIGGDAPEARNPLQAHAAFFGDHLKSIQQVMANDGIASFTLVLPPASSDHDAWRRAVAGDLAREFTPKRVNIAAGVKGEALDTVLTFLRDAPGVTGHYLQAHD